MPARPGVASVSHMSPAPSLRVVSVLRSSLTIGALVLGVAACGDTGKITVAGESTPLSTTTTIESDVDTTVPTTAPETTTSTPADDVTTTLMGGPGGAAGPADQDATDNSWTASPGEFRGQDGLRVAYTCPPGGPIASLWGTGPFTDDSSVCTAGVFAGLITVEGGGRVVVEIAPGAESYATGEANGVTAQQYGTWAGSFILPTA